VEKRQGTHYIASANATITWAATTTEVQGAEYPTLQALTAGEIPTAPVQPADTAAATTVSNAVELEAMSGATQYILTTDIDLNGVGWTPITGFTGVLDGAGYTISNLTINTPAADNVAMFGTVGDGCEIYDLTLDNFTITGDDKVACLIAEHNATGSIQLSDIAITGSTLVGDSLVAPLVAVAWTLTGGDIFNCDVSTTTITATDSSGGLLGDIDLHSTASADLNIVSCDVTGGTLTCTEDLVGGFAGYLFGRTVAESDKVHVHTCTTSMALSSPAQTSGTSGHGGFAGSTGNVVHFVTCSSTGAVTIGGSTSSLQAVGGFLGLDGGFTNCINSYSTGAVTIDASNMSTLQEVGGFVGKWDSGTAGQKIYRRCYATGDIDLTFDGTCQWDQVGGFGGAFLTTGTTQGNTLIERCWATGDITSDNGDLVPSDTKGATGAFLGALYHISGINTQTTTIQNCYAWGSVAVDPLSASDASYTGFIGGAYVGSGSKEWILLNCYDAQTNTAAGSGLANQIPVVTYGYGLLGFESAGATITDPNAISLFYDTETSGVSSDSYATAHTTAWMQTKNNYELAGWNFDTIWVIANEGSAATVTGDVDIPTAPVRLIAFVPDTDTGRIIEMGDQYFTFYKDVP
jgi:hypothetical protein